MSVIPSAVVSYEGIPLVFRLKYPFTELIDGFKSLYISRETLDFSMINNVFIVTIALQVIKHDFF